jgi:hypothetical protein
MKKNRLLILFSSLACAISLGSCFLFPDDNNEVDLPFIETVSKLKINLSTSKKSKGLYPELCNSTDKNPVFTYKSSNTNVATVSSSGVVTGVKTGSAKITVTLKSNTDIQTTVNVQVTNETKPHYDYTFMYYMAGSTLEYDPDEKGHEEVGLISDDLKEILTHQMPESVQIIVETGGAGHWSLESSYLKGATSISSTNLQRWEVTHDASPKLKLLESLPTNKMASHFSLREFVECGLEDYEADNMGVIFSGHGGGIAGCCYDDNYLDKDDYPNTLNTVETSKAFKQALSNSEKDKMSFVGYDCCVMQDADIASVNADYFDYMVGSQELESGEGWKHDHYLNKVKTESPTDIKEVLSDICDSFLSSIHSSFENKPPERYRCMQTLSVLDLSKMPAFTTAFNTFSNALGTTKESYNSAVSAFRNSYNDFGEKCYGLCDLKSFISNFSGLNSERQAILDFFEDDSFVIHNSYCEFYSTNPCGLNAFVPLSLKTKTILQVGEGDYTNDGSYLATKFSSWQKMCLNHGNFDF